jgi:hypothetical protein
MIGLTNNIKVTIIRNAAGFGITPTTAGRGKRATTYATPSMNVSLELPSAKGSNTYELYDPSMPHKVINIMNFYGARSSDYVPFGISDLDSPLDLSCELKSGDELVIVLKSLLPLRKSILFGGISNKIVSSQTDQGIGMTQCGT